MLRTARLLGSLSSIARQQSTSHSLHARPLPAAWCSARDVTACATPGNASSSPPAPDASTSGPDSLAQKARPESREASRLVTRQNYRVEATYIGATIDVSALHSKPEFQGCFSAMHRGALLLGPHQNVDPDTAEEQVTCARCCRAMPGGAGGSLNRIACLRLRATTSISFVTPAAPSV